MMRRALHRKHLRIIVAAVLFALGAYLVGFTFLLPVVGIGLGARYLPVPTVLNSWFGRLFASLLVSLTLLQLVAIIQFFLWPQSMFMGIAVLYAAFIIGFCSLYGGRNARSGQLLSRYDLAGLIVVGLFLVPFGGVLVGQDSILRITEIGGLQSPDAAHHLEFINAMSAEQHLDTSGYPKSFHLSLGFMQNALGITQSALSWQHNVALFFMQYVVFGGMLGLGLWYLCAAWIERVLGRAMTKVQLAVSVAALALPVCGLILWPFVVHGFLNYFYTLVALTAGFLYLNAFHLSKENFLSPHLAVGLLLLFGASQSWPLIAPAILVSLALFLPIKWTALRDMRRHFRWEYAVVAGGICLQCLPVVMQLMHAGRTSVNDPGDLRTLHVFVILAGIGLLLYVAHQKWEQSYKHMLWALFAPFMVLCGGLVAMQLFVLGEVRYFSIKVSLLVEALIIILGTMVLCARYFESIKHFSKITFFIPLIPTAAFLLLVAASPEPLADLRNLFRDQSGKGKPAYYDQDAYLYTALGKAGKIDHFNSTVLHYNTDTGKMFAHSFLPQWVQFIKYPRTESGLAAKLCHRSLFHIITYGTFTAEEQKQLIHTVRDCAHLVRQEGQSYFIVTDTQSLPYLKKSLGEDGIVYVNK